MHNKNLSKLRIEGNCLNLIRDIYAKPLANFCIDKLTNVCPIIRNTLRMPPLTPSFQHCNGNPSNAKDRYRHNNLQRKK